MIGHVYIAIGSGGLVKIGRSKDAWKRRVSISRDFSFAGESVEDFFVGVFDESATIDAERHMLEFAKSLSGASVAHGNEYFRGVDPQSMVAELEKMSGSLIKEKAIYQPSVLEINEKWLDDGFSPSVSELRSFLNIQPNLKAFCKEIGFSYSTIHKFVNNEFAELKGVTKKMLELAIFQKEMKK